MTSADAATGPQGTDDPAPQPREPRPPAEPLDGGGLVVGVVTERLKGALPAFLVGLLVGLIAGRRGV